jgi:hypothetical protein
MEQDHSEKIQKNMFSGLCQKFPQTTDEVKNFFVIFLALGSKDVRDGLLWSEM